jgi:hypothetical protein
MPTKRKDPTEHLPDGRPSLYDASHCVTVIELGRKGKSFTQIACALDVSKATLTRWADDHPEFRTALTRAKEHEQDWWETQGQEGLSAERFNAAVWRKSMEARFRDDYTERKEVSGKLTISHEDALAGLE